ncbi:MAG TPA: lipopolysaccharide biosynthesis protein [Bryobacteraceae bacterium]|nr:lipopolysaccharide biosynthesis protein [Bryobacteraceae bacterium]
MDRPLKKLLQKLPDPGPVWRALSWNSVATAGKVTLGFARAVILARLLSPDDYGLFGLSTVLLTAVSSFTNLRLGSSFIVRKFNSTAERNAFLNTIWTADLARYAIISLLVIATSHHAAAYMGDPRLASILLITGLTPLVTGFTNIGLSVLQKELNFKYLSLQALAVELMQFVVGVALAWYYRNVWAMVWTQLAITAFGVAISYVIHPFRPRFAFNRTAFAQAFGYGKHLLLTGILTFFTTQFDKFAVGKYLGTSTLGAYLIAYRLATLPLELLGELSDQVLFSAYAKARIDDPKTFRRLFLRALNGCVLLLVPAAIGMYAVAHEAVVWLYGSKWAPAVPMLEALVAVSLTRGISRAISLGLQSYGRSGLDAAGKCVEAAVFVPSTVLLSQSFGAVGAAAAGALSYGVGALVRSCFLLKLIPELRRDYLLSFANHTVIGALAFAALLMLRLHMHGAFAALLVLPLYIAAVFMTNPSLRGYLHELASRSRATVAP